MACNCSLCKLGPGIACWSWTVQLWAALLPGDRAVGAPRNHLDLGWVETHKHRAALEGWYVCLGLSHLSALCLRCPLLQPGFPAWHVTVGSGQQGRRRHLLCPCLDSNASHSVCSEAGGLVRARGLAQPPPAPAWHHPGGSWVRLHPCSARREPRRGRRLRGCSPLFPHSRREQSGQGWGPGTRL